MRLRLIFAPLLVMMLSMVSFAEEMNEDCRKVIAAHQNWVNASQNYVEKANVFDSHVNLVGETKTLKDYVQKKKYSKTVNLGSSVTVYTVDDFTGDVTQSVVGIGSRVLGPSTRVGTARPLGDGTGGVFGYGKLPDRTIKDFETIGENFRFIIGTDNKEGLQGVRYRFKQSFLEARTKNIGQLNIGTKEKEEQVKKITFSLRDITLWVDVETGELKGIDVAMGDGTQSSITFEIQERNIGINSDKYKSLLEEITFPPQAEESRKSLDNSTMEDFGNLALKKAVDDLIDSSKKTSPNRLFLIVNIVLLVVILLVLCWRRRKK
ncbi:MAG: hypothetical protein LBG58_01600 [Planctomycetaceae bacterium]|jgi:hypothetical protein|nr:hypothetical protein [Planctomycetaceae bacterium]